MVGGGPHPKCENWIIFFQNILTKAWDIYSFMLFPQYFCLSIDVQMLGQRMCQKGLKMSQKRGLGDVRRADKCTSASEVSGVEPSLSLATSSAIAQRAWPSFRPQSIITLDSITLIIIILILMILIPIILVLITLILIILVLIILILIILIPMTLILILKIPILIIPILTLIVQSTEHQPANNHHPHPCCYNHPSKR